MASEKLSDQIQEKVREAIGATAVIFMSEEIPGNQIVMPTQQLADIALVKTVEIMEAILQHSLAIAGNPEPAPVPQPAQGEHPGTNRRMPR